MKPFLCSFEGTLMWVGESFSHQTLHCIGSEAGECEPEPAIEPMRA